MSEDTQRKKFVRQVNVSRVHRRPFLLVTIQKAVGVASKDDNGLSDPYCRVTLRGKTVQTKIHFETLNPIWNETFELQPGDNNDELRFNCWDYDEGTLPDFLGYHNVSLNPIFDKLQTQPYVEECYPLLARSTDSDITGELYVKYQLKYLDENEEKDLKLKRKFEKYLLTGNESESEKEALLQLSNGEKRKMIRDKIKKTADEYVGALLRIDRKSVV